MATFIWNSTCVYQGLNTKKQIRWCNNCKIKMGSGKIEGANKPFISWGYKCRVGRFNSSFPDTFFSDSHQAFLSAAHCHIQFGLVLCWTPEMLTDYAVHELSRIALFAVSFYNLHDNVIQRIHARLYCRMQISKVNEKRVRTYKAVTCHKRRIPWQRH